MSRGDVYLADLNPSRGSEQDGLRPVIIVQRESLNRFTRTTMVVPLTTNLRRTQVTGTILNSFLECPPLSALFPLSAISCEPSASPPISYLLRHNGYLHACQIVLQ